MERRIAAIMLADIAGYSRLTEADEIATLELQKAHLTEVIEPTLAEHNGDLVKSTGDGFLAAFPSVIEAVNAAISIQRTIERRDADVAQDRRLRYRLGINLGDVVFENGDVHGNGVNVAARLEAIADPGGICISGTAYDQVRSAVEVGYAALGDIRVKNFTQPVRAYKLLLDPEQAGTFIAAPSGWRPATIAIVGLVAGATLLVTSFLMFPDFRNYLTDLVPGRGGTAPKIAVRPFTPLSGDESERQLAGGVTIGVTYALYSITDKELLVITAPQTAAQSGEASVPADFASDLGVRYLIHGALERDEDTVRVFVSFYDAEIGADIWQDRFDSDFTEAFSLQDAITLRILQGLDIDLSTAERNRLQYLDDTEVLSAWLLAANGVRNLITLDPKHLDEALVSYKRALQFDPDYISARRGLAWHALLDVRFGLAEDPERSIREARQHLDVILRRRPNDGMSLALQALMLILENDWDAAIKSGRRATRLLPGSADVWAVLAHNYTFSGQPDLALEAIDRAMSLSPGHPDFYSWIKGRALRLKGDYETAIEYVSKGLNERSPTIAQLVELATVYSAAGQQAEALETGKQIRRIDPDFSASEWLLHPALKDSEAQNLEFELLSKAGL